MRTDEKSAINFFYEEEKKRIQVQDEAKVYNIQYT